MTNENEPHTLRESVTRKLEPAVREQELANLNAEVNHPITAETLSGWIGRNPDREMLFSGTVCGTIRWPKSLGRPIVPTLASAFFIEHVFWQCLKTNKTGRITYELFTVPQITEPSKWDVPAAQHYQVSFMTDYAQGHEESSERCWACHLVNRIRVYFSPDVVWERLPEIIGGGFRVIEPSQRYFSKKEGLIVLDPFEVRSRPYVRGPN